MTALRGPYRPGPRPARPCGTEETGEGSKRSETIMTRWGLVMTGISFTNFKRRIKPFAPWFGENIKPCVADDPGTCVKTARRA
ncbi:hypothetical protein EVAR_66689_1 [Eumeta japonica]|uniref:Uncharacterized protein n=1 Tax=Eumeta variegata TaxID=151549 RepID=A0A4C1ZMX6_EUMVA|nr:hypothetical protein EVAR_66689_1 [Eumeta japonica]